jgi:hypothetical protein
MRTLLERISEEKRNKLVLDANDGNFAAQVTLDTIKSKHYYTELTIGEVCNISYALATRFEIQDIVNLFES